MPRCTHVPSFVSLAQNLLSPEDPTSKHLLRPWRVQLASHRNGTPNGFLSWYSTRVTCEFWVQWLPPFDPQGREKIFGSPFTGRHVPRATYRRSTRDRHHSRSGVSVRPSVPPRSRSDQPFRALFPEMLGHTYTQTDKHQPPNFFSPTHRRKSSFIRTCYAKALAPFYSLRFWSALCIPSQNGMHHRITLIELHQCTKFWCRQLKVS